MKLFRFALRRVLRPLGLPCLLLLCAAAILLTALWTPSSPPPSGLCDLSGSEASSRIAALLAEEGWQQLSSPEELAGAVRRGELTCGLILPADLEGRMAAGDLSGAFPFLSSPTSYAPDRELDLAAAAIFREYAPVLTAAALSHTSITPSQAEERYRSMLAEGEAFLFELRTEDGQLLSSAHTHGPTLGAVALLLLAALFSGIASLTESALSGPGLRLTPKQAVLALLLPGGGAIALFAAAVTAAALLCAWLAGASFALSLLPGAMIYILLLSALALLLTALLSRRQMAVLTALILPAALALCPIFTDPALLSPFLGGVRQVLPPQWLWSVREAPLPWLAASVLLIPAAAALHALRLTYRRKPL